MTNFHDHVEAWEAEVTQLTSPHARVCQRCITDPHLWDSVTDAAEPSTCDFCHTATRVITFDDLRVVIESVLNDLYVSVDESGAYHDDGEWSETVEDVQVILEHLLAYAVDNHVLAPLVAYISYGNAIEYGFVLRRDVWGSLYDSDEGAWRNFMARAREGEIISAAQHMIGQLPDEVGALLARIEQVAHFEGLFKSSSPMLWRCRPGNPEDNFVTGAELGSPPAEFAGDGRLNPKNQSVFYGSTTLRGAVMEMVHHHGIDVELWAGRFVPSTALYHLDVMEPPMPPSPFAPGAADTYDAITFLHRFAQTLREPKTAEPRHYFPTQIFAAWLLASWKDLRIDAIRYGSSVDPSSENWAVFADHDNCRDVGDPIPSKDKVYMLLERSTARFTVARDLIR